MAAAPVVGSFISLNYGWRGNFCLLLLLGIACFCLGYAFLPNGKRNNNASIKLSEYKKILKNKKAMYYVLTICFFGTGYWVFIAMAPILYMNDLGVKLENFGFYQGTLAAIFAIISVLNEKLFNYFGTRKCFFVGVGLVVVSLFFILILMLTNSRNQLLITIALAVMSAGIICPINILCPYAFEAAPNEKGKLGGLFVFIKWISVSFFVQCASYFYNGSFFPIGIIIFAITVCALVLCRKLFKIENIFTKK